MDFNPNIDALITRIQALEKATNRREGKQRESAIFQKVAEVTQKGLWAADLQGNILYINQNACHLIGASSPEEFTGKCVYQYYSPSSRERLMAEILPLVMTDGHWGGEMSIESFFGVTIHTYEHFFLVSDDEGAPLYLCALVNDISQQKSIENPFLRNEEKYRIITEQTGLLLCDHELSTGYVLWSGAIEGITGFKPDEFRSFDIDTWRQRIHEEDFQRVKDVVERARTRGDKYRVEYRAEQKGGADVHIEESGVFINDLNGQPIKMFGVMKDITKKSQYEKALSQEKARLEIEVEKRTANLSEANAYLKKEIEHSRQMEQAFRESEERYRAIVEDQTELVNRFTEEFKVTYVNEALCRYFSTTPEQIVGKAFIPLIHEDDRDKVTAFYATLTPEKPLGSTTHRVVLSNGALRWHQWNGRALFDPTGKLLGYQSTGRDITERIKVEEALRESEKQYRAVVEGQTELIGRFLPDYRMTFVNDVICRYFSKSRDELIGSSFLPFIHLEDRGKVKKFYEALTPEQPLGMDEHRVLLPSGEIRWQQWNARGIFDENGLLIEFQSVGRDITDRIRAEEALRESEERYRIVTKHSADGVVVSRRGRLMYVNDAFAYMCGFEDPRELTGKELAEFIDPAYREKTMTFIDAVESGKASDSVMQAVIMRPDGRKMWGEGLHTVIQWGGLPAVLATVRDVTKAKEREIESKRETKALRRQNIQLASTIKDRYRFGNIIGKSPAMQDVYEQILSASSSNANVVLYGESGTGKELVAAAIHDLSERSEAPFVPVNCGAIPEHLMESEFFGHKRGAFTGANDDKKGYLDFANTGTLFLDEVGNIGIGIQVRLLRAIEGGGHTPLGSNQVKRSDFRIISATNRPLMELVKEGLMREDFFFRVHIVPIYLPPLRERKEDILLLIDHFMRSLNYGKEQRSLPGKILDAFVRYDWPGNVRELQNVLQRYLTMGRLEFETGWTSKALELEPVSEAEAIEGEDLKDKVENFEKHLILKSLEKAKWNRRKVCDMLKIPRRTLTYKLSKHGIK